MRVEMIARISQRRCSRRTECTVTSYRGSSALPGASGSSPHWLPQGALWPVLLVPRKAGLPKSCDKTAIVGKWAVAAACDDRRQCLQCRGSAQLLAQKPCPIVSCQQGRGKLTSSLQFPGNEGYCRVPCGAGLRPVVHGRLHRLDGLAWWRGILEGCQVFLAHLGHMAKSLVG